MELILLALAVMIYLNSIMILLNGYQINRIEKLVNEN